MMKHYFLVSKLFKEKKVFKLCHIPVACDCTAAGLADFDLTTDRLQNGFSSKLFHGVYCNTTEI